LPAKFSKHNHDLDVLPTMANPINPTTSRSTIADSVGRTPVE
jgi:hypothetical protein